MRRFVAALLLAAGAAAAQPPADPRAPAETAKAALPTPNDPVAAKRAVALGNELRCLVCQNQSIEESNAELAVDLRRQIREQIAQGKSDREIIDYMVARYGDFVLYRPPFKATTALLWIGPFLLLAVGLAAARRVIAARRARADERPLTEAERREAERLLAGARESE
ncbi:MAG: cytochrome c-type biogenesis protein CcmH [Burkholderiales bacterium]|nr:cytochrome c-type biogenesis protein CcmH [Burkholderiales bacterium]